MTQHFLELTKFWYEYVSCDHHKDRDCHFYVNQVWSYGQPFYYRIEHYGYMAELPDEIGNERFESYELAHARLEQWLDKEVREVISFYKDYVPKESDDYNHKGVMEVCQKYKHLLG